MAHVRACQRIHINTERNFEDTQSARTEYHRWHVVEPLASGNKVDAAHAGVDSVGWRSTGGFCRKQRKGNVLENEVVVVLVDLVVHNILDALIGPALTLCKALVQSIQDNEHIPRIESRRPARYPRIFSPRSEAPPHSQAG